ncbi:hypothetical protein BDV24DRAFT_156783 [Aspergillus arachidicola]|uniref:Uncharacterized protein n=1 Tax=Aspergillus arachidicola TaxID=656916 RepID=A0A5N6XQA8_9EURO|nr:hypothetical protein BDV24DRAFT_156783 [Aspergillus arachidicola]
MATTSRKLSLDVILHHDPRGGFHIVCSVAPHEIWISALEAVVIDSPTDCHVVHTLAATEHGVHELCEELVTTDLSLMGRLTEVTERNPKQNIKQVFQMIQEGSISDPTVVRSHGVERLDKSGFYIEYDRQGSGIFVDTVTKALWASGLIAHHHELKDCQDADNAVGVVEFWEGKVWVNLVPHHHRVQILDSSGIVQDGTPGWIDRYREASVTELERFRAVVLEGKELLLLLTIAYFGLQIALALQESLRTGRKIGFDDNGVRKEQEGGVAKH